MSTHPFDQPYDPCQGRHVFAWVLATASTATGAGTDAEPPDGWFCRCGKTRWRRGASRTGEHRGAWPNRAMREGVVRVEVGG